MEPVPYTFVSVNRRNNEARVHIAMLKYGKLAAKSLRGYTDTFYSVEVRRTYSVQSKMLDIL